MYFTESNIRTKGGSGYGSRQPAGSPPSHPDYLMQSNVRNDGASGHGNRQPAGSPPAFRGYYFSSLSQYYVEEQWQMVLAASNATRGVLPAREPPQQRRPQPRRPQPAAAAPENAEGDLTTRQSLIEAFHRAGLVAYENPRPPVPSPRRRRAWTPASPSSPRSRPPSLKRKRKKSSLLRTVLLRCHKRRVAQDNAAAAAALAATAPTATVLPPLRPEPELRYSSISAGAPDGDPDDDDPDSPPKKIPKLAPFPQPEPDQAQTCFVSRNPFGRSWASPRAPPQPNLGIRNLRVGTYLSENAILVDPWGRGLAFLEDQHQLKVARAAEAARQAQLARQRQAEADRQARERRERRGRTMNRESKERKISRRSKSRDRKEDEEGKAA